jgi:hypothetical protein
MYIEEIIDKLVGVSSWITSFSAPTFMNSYDLKMIESFDQQINRSLALTEKQADMALRILKRYETQISSQLKTNVALFLTTPQFKFGKRVINQEKTVKISKDLKRDHKVIRVSFPYDEKLVECIKEYKKISNALTMQQFAPSANQSVEWDITERTWNFYLYEEHVDWLWQNLSNKNFVFDQDLQNFVSEIEQIKNSMGNYIPMVISEGENFKFVNTHQSIPQPTSNDLLEVLFFAKKYGIYCWDEKIDNALNNNSTSDFTKQVLRANLGKELPKNDVKITSDDLLDTIKYSKHCLFVIPGGSEQQTLEHCFNFLKEAGYNNEDMTVLFRLDSSAGAICNEFVKNNHLNNPISEKIKIFFVSGKIPKPLIGSTITFDTIFNLGNNSVHYTVRNLIKNHHCVINYNTSYEKKEFNFAHL